jgi:hypothetical protein
MFGWTVVITANQANALGRIVFRANRTSMAVPKYLDEVANVPLDVTNSGRRSRNVDHRILTLSFVRAQIASFRTSNPVRDNASLCRHFPSSIRVGAVAESTQAVQVISFCVHAIVFGC